MHSTWPWRIFTLWVWFPWILNIECINLFRDPILLILSFNKMKGGRWICLLFIGRVFSIYKIFIFITHKTIKLTAILKQIFRLQMIKSLNIKIFLFDSVKNIRLIYSTCGLNGDLIYSSKLHHSYLLILTWIYMFDSNISE